jgi:hypothetical protein
MGALKIRAAKRLKILLPAPPKWARAALQGVTFWIGHQRSRYNRHSLGESAIVAEVRALATGHLGSDAFLDCESNYRELANPVSLPVTLRPNARADMVICEKPAVAGGRATPKFVVEIKRGSASTASIDTDLQRLADFGSVVPTVRLFLFIVCEANRHARFIDGKGKARTPFQPVPGRTGPRFKVRRVYRAAHSFDRRETAHYGILVEVYRQ